MRTILIILTLFLLTSCTVIECDDNCKLENAINNQNLDECKEIINITIEKENSFVIEKPNNVTFFEEVGNAFSNLSSLFQFLK